MNRIIAANIVRDLRVTKTQATARTHAIAPPMICASANVRKRTGAPITPVSGDCLKSCVTNSSSDIIPPNHSDQTIVSAARMKVSTLASIDVAIE